MKDSDGYAMKVTVRIGTWVKGSDATAMTTGWQAVGGTGNMPLTDGNYSGHYGFNGINFKQNTAVYVFGTMSFQNASPAGYSAKDVQDAHGGTLSFDIDGGSGTIYPLYCVWYSSGAQTKCTRADTDYLVQVNPDFTSDTWGPVPFVAALPLELTPNNPSGDTALDQNFKIGGFGDVTNQTTFTIKRGW